ncbi:acyl-CoA carboxylase subunit epsilon [Cumulibacter soli]|uniref:acyl-CoA carboxylase subunit epsilon n=1 Tax=Cumulibacter soli TaxID=2546344 RepID=UPI0010684B37|nr:acyl-CoA carboxylase subunit epsilon [Cumulibacter soli]
MSADENKPDELKVLFRVSSGNPTAEELAALTVILAAASAGGGEEPEPTPVGGWASPARRMRSIGTAGHGGWRAEFSPR